jgi:hypothetical protein
MACGDRLRVERRLKRLPIRYMHHGIDVGDGTVVHSRPDDAGRLFGGGRITRTSLAAFADGSPIDVVTEPPAAFPGEEIVARALGQVGREGYCPVFDNCEHFTTWCATGHWASRQIEVVVKTLSRVVATTATFAFATVAVRDRQRTASGRA